MSAKRSKQEGFTFLFPTDKTYKKIDKMFGGNPPPETRLAIINLKRLQKYLDKLNTKENVDVKFYN